MTYINTKENEDGEKINSISENITELTVDKITFEIALMKPQIHKNIVFLPIKTKASKTDILTVKKGFELGLISIEECQPSTVNQILVKNNSKNPLILIDGDEILGANQNRIINASTLVGPKSVTNISVSCVEKGRWAFKSDFKDSTHIATSKTRSAKSKAICYDRDIQSEVWKEIHELEDRNSFYSKTQAMAESYEKQKSKHKEYLNEFKKIKGQTGAMIFVNGEFEGMDIFFNPEIYSEYHEKILKSYLIDQNDASEESFNKYNIYAEALEVLENIEKSKIKETEPQGIGRNITLFNDIGIGSALIYGKEILHIPFLKNHENVTLY